MSTTLRRDALLRFKVESELARAVDTAARQRGMTTSEWVRQAARAQLASHGVRLGPSGGDDSPTNPPAAPALKQAA